jgi:aminoglycoside/choline kinase family phosphotransferase
MPLSTISPNPTDSRFTQLTQWLTTLQEPQLRLESLRPASSDASFRRYFRVDAADGGASYIAMDAPPPQENVGTFVHVAKIFDETGVSVPKILAQDLENGFLLLSDLGTVTYLHELNPDSAYKLYMDAIDALVMIQVHSRPDVLPEYDRATLLREMTLFPEWYVGKHLATTLTVAQSGELNKVFDALLANNLAQPQTYVHRDYHSRNLMVLASGNPGILDFQDALYGPITYDIVSLLRDAYIQWDEEVVLDLAIRYWERAKRAGLPVNPDIDAFYRDFEYMGLQRHLKVLGIFTRLLHRDGKDGYMKDLPLVMSYTRATASRYKELKPLVRLLDQLEDKAPQVGYTF